MKGSPFFGFLREVEGFLELVLVGNVENVDGLADILGCGVSSLPMKYFGLLLGASYKAKYLGRWIGEEFKFHPPSWSKVCSPIFERGLGVWNLLMFNCALRRKWLWRYVHERRLVESCDGC
jgi:hypothetical protein